MNEKEKILNRLSFQFFRAEEAYSIYLKEKIYLYASIIRNANSIIYEILMRNVHLFDENERKHAQKIIFHYDIWLAQFTELENELKPKLNSIFVFERYPGTPSFPFKSKDFLLKVFKKN